MAAPTSSIIDPITSSSQKVESNTRSARVTLWHQDFVTGATGSYRKSQTSGTIAAGLSAASLVYAFQWAPTPTGALCVPRRIALTAGNSATAFVAGFANFQLFAARAYTVVEGTGGTAGTKTGNNSKLRTIYGTTLGANTYISTTAAISGGTSTLDTDPFAAVSIGIPAVAGTVILPVTEVYRALPSDQPLVFANQEGFVIKATVPGTGTWQLGVDVAWDEYPSGSF